MRVCVILVFKKIYFVYSFFAVLRGGRIQYIYIYSHYAIITISCNLGTSERTTISAYTYSVLRFHFNINNNNDNNVSRCINRRHRTRVCTYLPSGFGEILFELCRNGSVDVLAAGRVAGNPETRVHVRNTSLNVSYTRACKII